MSSSGVAEYDPWGMFELEVKSAIYDALRSAGIEADDSAICIEAPPPALGDLAFPVFVLARSLKKEPVVLAKIMHGEIKHVVGNYTMIAKVVQNGPYLNFFVNMDVLGPQTLLLIIEKDKDYGTLPKRSEKVIVEHTSANPTDALHVGRARNPIIGDSLARIYRAAGYEVETQYYVDDMGKQAVILAYGLETLAQDLPTGRGPYQYAYELYEKDEACRKKIEDWVKRLETGDAVILRVVRSACDRIMAEKILPSLKSINVHIDKLVYESEFIDATKNLIEKLAPHCNEDKGALYIDMAPYGLNERFYITRSDGTSLYATRDIAYHLWKCSKGDIVVDVLGEDHKLESFFVRTVIEKILNLEAKIVPLFYSFVTLPEGRMSTRRGRVVYLDDLVAESVDRARAEVEKRRAVPRAVIEKIAKAVGVGALRYNIIKVQPEKKITFRWKDALNFEGNSAPFIQYAHARACSILKKGGGYSTPPALRVKEDSEIDLIKALARFPSAVSDAAENMAPHKIAHYAYDLACKFNLFYRDCPVISAQQPLRDVRMIIVDAFRITVRNALSLLGIEAPEEM